MINLNFPSRATNGDETPDANVRESTEENCNFLLSLKPRGAKKHRHVVHTKRKHSADGRRALSCETKTLIRNNKARKLREEKLPENCQRVCNLM